MSRSISRITSGARITKACSYSLETITCVSRSQKVVEVAKS